MEKRKFEEIHGKIPDNITYIDLDAQPKPVMTEGWTDEQIRAKSLDDLNLQVMQAELGVESLRDTLNKEVERIEGLKRVRARKLLLGD
jgi:hypothetical protein